MLRRTRTVVLLQTQIEHAMKVTRSNRGAAEYLRVSYPLYCKFAKTYTNSEGVTLFDAHKNQSGRGITKLAPSAKRFSLDEIVRGKHPSYPAEKLLRRLVISGYVEEKCNHCGYCEKRPTDQATPLLLHHIDGNTANHVMSNLELLCYNCYFMLVGNIRMNKLFFDRPEHEIEQERAAERSGEISNQFEVLTEQEKLELIKNLANGD